MIELAQTDPCAVEEEVFYPESDGKPMADNTRQFRYIVMIQGGLDLLFRTDPQVFVAGDLLWYPVQGRRDISTAPDTLVVFGRPKGDRGSYKQWEEAGIPPQVVFEVLSPGNRPAAMQDKLKFYEQYGVEEYYLYDPDDGMLDGWLRQGAALYPIPAMHGWISPRLGIRFELNNGELHIFSPDGRRFETFVEQGVRADQERQEREAAEARAEVAQARAARLAAQLRALGIEPAAEA